MLLLLLLVGNLISSSNCLFPGAQPDEGDVRHLYPLRQIVIGLKDHAYSLPYMLGWLENIDYPKQRLNVEFYLSGSVEAASNQLSWWQESVKGLFRSIVIKIDEEDWLESGLRSARMKKMASILILSGNTIPREFKLLQHLSLNKTDVILCPLFSPSIEGEIWNNPIVTQDNIAKLENIQQIDKVSLPLFMNLQTIDASYLTFDSNNIPNYSGSNDYVDVFHASASKMGIKILLDSAKYYGVFIDDNLGIEEQAIILKYHLCDLVASSLPLPPVSHSVRPWTPEPQLPKNIDKVYLINLKRREDRFKRMDQIFSILGIEYSLLEASDGKNLGDDFSYNILPGYLDPFHKRPIKSGEVGCFLSHYRIWQNVVDQGLKQVLVFEDDLRFSLNGIEHIVEVLEDLEASKLEWDLIYVGRKKQSIDEQELWVPEHRHLSTVEYSYWTLGYLLSQSGAKKLLEAKPLANLLPVDEYIPIMFDRHPNEEWKSFFPQRNLKAYTLFPLSVTPQRYTTDVGYVSDTEDSVIISTELPTTRDEL